jgi:hypothetical protein
MSLTPPEAPPLTSTNDTNLIVALTRVETKVDVVLSQHGAKLEDHEGRLRKVEARRTVSPRTLWTSVISAAGLVLTLIAIFDRFLPPN